MEENNEDNIVSVENFESMNEGYLLKAPKKGKLRKGPNWTAYKRENLGSIPRKTENILVDEKENKTHLGFNSSSERFYPRAQTVKYNYPGPGNYTSAKGFDFTKTNNAFYSSKAAFDAEVTGPKVIRRTYHTAKGDKTVIVVTGRTVKEVALAKDMLVKAIFQAAL